MFLNLRLSFLLIFLFCYAADAQISWSDSYRTDGNEYIFLFDTPTKANHIILNETVNPGQVEEVLIEYNKELYEVYDGFPHPINMKQRTLVIFIGDVTGSIPIEKVHVKFIEDSFYDLAEIGLVNGTSENVINSLEASNYENIFWELGFTSERELLPEQVNTKVNELKPLISPNGRRLYYIREKYEENTGGRSDLQDIYYNNYNNGTWSNSYNIGKPLNTSGSNGICSISPDGNVVYLINDYNRREDQTGLVRSQVGEDGYEIPRPVEIKDYYNKSPYTDFFIHPNGKIMIMALDRDDTRGDQDLYVSFQDYLNEWSEPKHLGVQINTSKAEFAPFLSSDLKTLFFSSYGHTGYGDADIFISRRLDDSWQNWSQPLNIGSELNTTGSDEYFSITADGQYGYFISQKDKDSSFDIYRIRIPESIRPAPSFIIEANTLNVVDKSPVSAEIYYESIIDREDHGKVLSSPKDGSFMVVVSKGQSYKWFAVAEGFVSISDQFTIPDTTETDYYHGEVDMVPIEVGKVITLEDILFEQGKTEILPGAESVLWQWVKTMQVNPTVEIEIQGHTDYAGDSKKNLQLSRERADEIMDFLIKNGIDKNRLKANGFGGERPVTRSMNMEERRANRRVDLLITDY